MRMLRKFDDTISAEDTTSKIIRHYGIRQEMKEEAEAGNRVDFLTIRAKDYKKDFNSIMGFDIKQSQRIIVDYDPDEECFIVRRTPRKYCGTADTAT